MKNQIKLGRFFGVEVGLHISWFIIAFLIVLSLGQEFVARNPAWSPKLAWFTAVVTACLFFITIIIHELAHSVVAKAHRIPVRGITLFALGGVSQIEKDSPDPSTEFWIGIAGPITSFVIGWGCFWLARGLGWTGDNPQVPALAVLVWLGYINLMLAFFNLVPGFPLDGGRVMRALLWWVTDDGARATRLAIQVGHWIAMGFIFFGIFRFFEGAGFSGLWLAFIGWFLNEAGHATALQNEWSATLKGLRVGDIMMRDYPIVPSSTDLDSFVHNFLLHTGRRCFVIQEDGENIGVLTPQDVKHVEKAKWPLTPVRDLAHRFNQLPKISTDASAQAALELMARDNVSQLAVVMDGHDGHDGRIEGIVSRGHILKLLEMEKELRLV